MEEQSIPVAKLADFYSSDRQKKQALVKTIGDALVDLGFFAVEDHGIDQTLIAKAYALAEHFFKLDLASKQKYEIKGWMGQRGYTSFGREHAKDSPAPDLKEFWHVGRESAGPASSRQDMLPNVWPEELGEFKETFLQLYQQIDQCALELLKACALYLGEEETLLSQMAVGGNSILRIIHYPPVGPTAPVQSIRAAAHEDINLITLLCEATTGGLELLDRRGLWRPIAALKGQLIVDAGDMLQNLSNGVFKSTTHRVVNPDNDRSRRFSMPFFCHPRSEVSLSPLASCIKRADGEQKFANITAGQYLQQRLQEIGLTQ